MWVNEATSIENATLWLADGEMSGIAERRSHDTTFIRMLLGEEPCDVWRVKIGLKVTVLHLQGEALRPTVSEYGDEAELPSWMQDRIMALRMINCEDPTDYITGLGRRLDSSTFWIEE